MKLIYVYYARFIMAAPPSYADLGKAARDLFNKGFSK